MDCPIFSHGYSYNCFPLKPQQWVFVFPIHISILSWIFPWLSQGFSDFSMDFLRISMFDHFWWYDMYIYIYISYSSMITSHFPMVFQKKTRDPARRNCRTPSKRLKPPCKQRPSVVSAPWAKFRVQSAGNDVTMGNPSCTKLNIIIWIIYIWPYSTIFKYMTVFKYIWPY
jgi:hypothetical protein